LTLEQIEAAAQPLKKTRLEKAMLENIIRRHGQ